jgi:hypothetical protein
VILRPLVGRLCPLLVQFPRRHTVLFHTPPLSCLQPEERRNASRRRK